MRKLKIIFKDGSKITYTIKDWVDWGPYFSRHQASSIKSAVFQQYPLKDNKPVILISESRGE